MTDAGGYMFLVRMDIPPEKEAEFNELYNNEHIPAILKVPGVLSATRYENVAEGEPKYAAVYEIESADLPNSEAWRKASGSGEWRHRIRPYAINRSHIIYKRIYPET